MQRIRCELHMRRRFDEPSCGSVARIRVATDYTQTIAQALDWRSKRAPVCSHESLPRLRRTACIEVLRLSASRTRNTPSSV